MAIPLLKHHPVGKTTHTPGYATSAVRYVMRQSAGNHIYSEHMPRQYHAAQRFVDAREANSRKNARVIDRFHLALPRELSPEQGIELTREFGRRLGEGRAPFLISVHTDNWAHNPHAHVIFIDADIETGKRVALTSERGSTQRIKRIWQDVANDYLELAGFDRSIDFSRAERAAQIERDRADELALEDLDDPVLAYEADNDDEADPVADTMERKRIERETDELVGLISTTNFIQDTRGKLEQAQSSLQRMERVTYERVVDARTDAQFAFKAKAQFNDSLNRFDAHRDTESGRLQGWSIRLFGFEYDNLARREAKSHQQEVLDAKENYRWAKEAAERSARLADDAKAAVKAKQVEIGEHEFNLSVYGEGKELGTVAYLHQASADFRLTGNQIDVYDRAVRDGVISEQDYRLIRDYHADMQVREDVTIELPSERVELAGYPDRDLAAEQAEAFQQQEQSVAARKAGIAARREELDEQRARGDLSDEDYVQERVALKEEEQSLSLDDKDKGKKQGLDLGY